jgi:hypothetical protein
MGNVESARLLTSGVRRRAGAFYGARSGGNGDHLHGVWSGESQTRARQFMGVNETRSERFDCRTGKSQVDFELHSTQCITGG